MGRKFVLVFLASLSALAVVEGCGIGESTELRCPTDPKDPEYNKEYCRWSRAQRADAGPDGADGSDGEPGSNPQAMCIPNAPDFFDGPQPFWFGPKAKVPNACPVNVGAFGALAYANLVAPTQNCPTCVCKHREGGATCSPTPSVLVRSEVCDDPSQTIDISPALSWDGSCTNAKALPAGAECPVGSGKPCAKSVYSGPLPGPVDECEPDELRVVGVLDDSIRWESAALSCNASEAASPGQPCGESAVSCEDSASCRHGLPTTGGPDDGTWRYCVRREGIHACEQKSAFKEQFVVFPYESFDDKRGCSACICSGAGGQCFGTLRVYEDEACASPDLFSDPKDSNMPACTNLALAGKAIGSIELTDRQYVPGTCEASGGYPVGTVELDTSRAVTWCCMAPEKAPAM